LNLSILDIDSLRLRSVIRFGKINKLDKIVVDVSLEEEGIYRVDQRSIIYKIELFNSHPNSIPVEVLIKENVVSYFDCETNIVSY
jgi:hypothetical protein